MACISSGARRKSWKRVLPSAGSTTKSSGFQLSTTGLRGARSRRGLSALGWLAAGCSLRAGWSAALLSSRGWSSRGLSPRGLLLRGFFARPPSARSLRGWSADAAAVLAVALLVGALLRVSASAAAGVTGWATWATASLLRNFLSALSTVISIWIGKNNLQCKARCEYGEVTAGFLRLARRLPGARTANQSCRRSASHRAISRNSALLTSWPIG
ncbi:hypothetical protein D3C85_525930 [compost metagenome]